ncbi:segregation/condensation protein A [Candidatus Azambacteria bacterium]|nr:segregation/condensation protein A [Candidatus Azambacteria bacterium]
MLELIEKEKLNISEISLTSVCDQFLEYTKHFENIQPLHLANFLVIASKLILIKSRSLLPFLELSKEEEEGIDELQERLKEFQKIKKGAELIRELELKKRICYERHSGLRNVVVFLPPKNITKEALCEFFLNVKNEIVLEKEPLEKAKIEAVISFEETISNIRKRIVDISEEYFHNIIPKDKASKVNVIMAFLAVLELVKQKFLLVEQEGNFANIKMIKNQS